MKTVDMIDKYHVDKNKMYKIEVPAWYLKEIMGLISERALLKEKMSQELEPQP